MDSILNFELSVIGLLTLFRYMTVSEATLVSNVSVACPGQTVLFTCTLPGSVVQWSVNPPPGSGLSRADSGILTTATELDQTFTLGSTGFMFQYVLTDASGGNITTTLTTITEVSLLSGSMVTCVSQTQEGPLTIQVADPPSSPLNPMLIGFQYGTSTSVVTLQWAPPTSTGGVDISYVLTVSPPPVSPWANITTQTSTDITVSYNIQYNVTIIAKNCAGSSQDTMVVFDLASPILCGLPQSPLNGSLGSHRPTSPLGTIVTFQCDDGLLPITTMNTTCTDKSGSGVWDPNPADLVCRIEPVICILPDLPVNGVIINYCNINTVEGSVITFQCNPGFSPEGGMTTTCTNAGVWSPDPAGVECFYNKIVGTPASTSVGIGGAVGISVVLSSIVSIIIGLVVGVMFTYCAMRRRINKGNEIQLISLPTSQEQQTTPSQQQTPAAGPVYEEVSLPKEEIELKTNQAYGPVRQ